MENDKNISNCGTFKYGIVDFINKYLKYYELYKNNF